MAKSKPKSESAGGPLLSFKSKAAADLFAGIVGIPEAAKYLSIPNLPGDIREYARSGGLTFKEIGGAMLLSRAEIEAWNKAGGLEAVRAQRKAKGLPDLRRAREIAEGKIKPKAAKAAKPKAATVKAGKAKTVKTAAKPKAAGKVKAAKAKPTAKAKAAKPKSAKAKAGKADKGSSRPFVGAGAESQTAPADDSQLPESELAAKADADTKADADAQADAAAAEDAARDAGEIAADESF